ncbi:radical SAM/SPASM domain-containing protein [Natronoglycomyces albus]|uniref:Radical SAM protein n=1 Tax=Natronoglycomyces albus TaxID=2811108 RepID=A0A895XR13_9ACTN|nr:radical SAM protein [Natronoglycomyces albus]QSB04710.1 radical SAM protein [Natronoglycomyces albus]
MKLKVSDYLHTSGSQYRADDDIDYRMIYATRTGTIACFPSDVVAQLENGHVEAIAQEHLSDLREIQAVVDAEVNELDFVLNRQRRSNRSLALRNYVLLPSSYCNMGCSYCGQLHKSGKLTDSHRDAVAKRVLAGINDEATEKVNISWFGGEPMAGYPVVVDLSRQFIAECERLGKGYKATMVTNGSLLTHAKARELIRDCQVSHLEITLDGPARIHDTHRPLKKGGGSFDHIISVLKQVLADDDLGCFHIRLRTNVDVNNREWVNEYIDLMAEHEFFQDQVDFNLVPVYSWGNDVSAIEVERSEFSKLQLDWYERMIDHGLHVSILPESIVGTVCSATALRSEVISSSGNVFSCTEHPLVPKHEMADSLGKVQLLPLTVRPVGPYDDWTETVESGKTWCATCKMLPVCGGACPKQWDEGNPPCPAYKFNVQERFDLIAQMNGLQVCS